MKNKRTNDGAWEEKMQEAGGHHAKITNTPEYLAKAALIAIHVLTYPTLRTFVLEYNMF